MIVCHCEAIEHRTIVAAIEAGAGDLDALGERCKAGRGCGGCVRLLECLIDSHRFDGVSPASAVFASR